jgi:hypothetical protein
MGAHTPHAHSFVPVYRPQKSCASERFVVDFGGKISKSRVFQPFWVGEENWLFQKMNQNLER